MQMHEHMFQNAYIYTPINTYIDNIRCQGYPVWQDTFVSPSAFSRRAVVSYWRKYVHEVLVNRLGGLSLPRKSVVRLTDRPDMTLDVYRGRKTTMQQIRRQDFKILLSTVTPTGVLVKTSNKSKTINIRGKLQALVLTTG